MANGFLTGKYNAASKFEEGDFRGFMPQYTEEGMQAGRNLMELVGAIAKEKEASAAQVSMAWMLCKKPYIVPIPGSRKTERMKENAGAADVSLTPDEVKRIDKALDDMEFLVFGGHTVVKEEQQ
jgi:aryl-alcohol dehydrogenase-like predicted oxidoreductase